jgi:hypothetical protein
MTSFLFSCDRATCAVPEAYRETFRGSEDVVASTEGWEPGSLNLAQGFSMRFRTPLVHGDVTCLLIDLARNGDERWSRFSQKLPEATRAKVADRHERPYRLALSQRIAEELRRRGGLVHVMIHTDPATEGLVMLETPPGDALGERVANAWRARLAPGVDVRHVSGVVLSPLAGGLAATYSGGRYAQIRLSISQSFFLEGRPLRWETLKKLILESLAQVETEMAALSVQEVPSTDPG